MHIGAFIYNDFNGVKKSETWDFLLYTNFLYFGCCPQWSAALEKTTLEGKITRIWGQKNRVRKKSALEEDHVEEDFL